MMQLGNFFDRINKENNSNIYNTNNERVHGENLTIDNNISNKVSLRMRNDEQIDKSDTSYNVRHRNLKASVYNNEINIVKTTKKQTKVQQQKFMKNNRTAIETSTIIPRQDFESLVSYGNFNTSINSEKESPLDTSIHSSSNGKFNTTSNIVSAMHFTAEVDDPFVQHNSSSKMHQLCTFFSLSFFSLRFLNLLFYVHLIKFYFFIIKKLYSVKD